MTAVLPATIMSSPSTLRKPRPFSRPTSNLLSIMIPIQPLNNSVVPPITTPPPPRSPPTPTTTRQKLFRKYFFHTTIFITVSIPNSFHSTVAIYFQHGSPIYFRHGTTIVDKSTNTFPTIHFQQTHFQQSARFIFFPLPRYRVSLLFQVDFPTLFQTNVITQIISILPSSPILF